MPPKTFEEEVIDRLARIETKQDSTMETVSDHSKTINSHSIIIAEVNASAKSAHHRIDGIFWGAGALGGIAGTLVNVFASFWSKTSGGGHG